MATIQPSPKAETVLVVGSTGNIGISAIIGALRSGRNVLAAVRNQASATKLFERVHGVIGKDDEKRITPVEVDVTSDQGVQAVVDRVKKGELPAFQHVYATVGGDYTAQSMLETSTEDLRRHMNVNFEANFFAYRATIPYLLDQQAHQDTTFTVCTGAQGDVGERALPAMSQGALFSMSYAGCRALAKTNVRFNEIYLHYRVEVDAVAEETGTMKASHFAKIYEKILNAGATSEVKSCRIRVLGYDDLESLKLERKA